MLCLLAILLTINNWVTLCVCFSPCNHLATPYRHLKTQIRVNISLLCVGLSIFHEAGCVASMLSKLFLEVRILFIYKES